MRIRYDFFILKGCFRLNPLIQLFFLLELTSCTARPEPYTLLEFTGKGAIFNYSRSIYPTLYISDSVRSTALLAGKGDLIAYGENCCFYYRGSSQNRFSLNYQDGKGFINDKINSICIPDNNDLIPWFRQMNDTDISDLGFLYFDSILAESYLPYITDLAKTKPEIGLGYDGPLMDMTPLFGIFKPEFIVGARVSQDEFDILSGLTTLKFLLAAFDDSAYAISLPAMPELKQLVITGIEENAIKTDDFLINNKQIEKLTIMGSGSMDLSLIKPLENLKQLVISGTDTIFGFDIIPGSKHLELLSVDGVKEGADLTLKKISGIRWVTFYEEETQPAFNSFIESHPDLEVVEILDNEAIIDLHLLESLGRLYGLTVSDTLTDFNTIKSLKNLKYLSLPSELLEDSTFKADLQSLLPGTVIVPNQGVCLGSGWLLLIVPLMSAIGMFRNKIVHRAKVRSQVFQTGHDHL